MDEIAKMKLEVEIKEVQKRVGQNIKVKEECAGMIFKEEVEK